MEGKRNLLFKLFGQICLIQKGHKYKIKPLVEALYFDKPPSNHKIAIQKQVKQHV
jgi:hypothetical protein